MLDLLSKVTGSDHGLGVVSYSGASSDLFLQLHYCSTFLTRRKRVFIITTHQTEQNYRLIFGKLALRWDPSLITVLELDSLLGDGFRVDADNLVKVLNELPFGDPPPSLVIFDDVSVLERLGMQPYSVVCLLFRMYSRLENDGLLLTTFSMKTKAYSMLITKVDFNIDITPIGLGYGKDVSGKMDINVHGIAPTPTTSQLLFLTGDRSIKCFYPGGNSFLSA